MISEAASILSRLTALGCRISVHGATLRVEARPALPPDLQQAVRDHKADLLELLTSRQRSSPVHPASPPAAQPFLQMPLATFATAGAPLEITVPWWAHTLWFVPDERHAALLQAEGVSRGRIWTAHELADLLRGPDAASARLAALVKLEFDGEVVEVRAR